MTDNIVARRYARALFALGKKSGLPELESYAAALADMRDALTASPALVNVFSNPIFTAQEKRTILEKIGKKIKAGATVLNFLLLLAEKKRFNEFNAIVDTFNHFLDLEKGILRGKLLTAVDLDDAKKAQVVTQLEKQAKKTLVLDFGVAPEILGGVVLQVGDQVMDASLRAQLSILKDTIKRGE